MTRLCAFLGVAAVFCVRSAFALSVTFFGGAGQVGGSCARVDGGGVSVLVDCGTAYSDEAGGSREMAETGFGFAVTNLTAVLITHAHQDHAGRVPELVRAGFRGPIVMTEPTRILLAAAWKSQLKYDKTISAKPKWSRRHQAVLDDLMSLVKVVPFDEELSFGGMKAVFRPVKHLPGSASIRFQDDEGSCIFSGDLGTYRSRLVKSIDPAVKSDAVFVETTYGAASHGTPEEIEAEYARFRQAVAQTVRSGGLAWIPAFAMDRSQRVLLEIERGIADGDIPSPAPIYFLSPSARAMTDAYCKNPHWFDGVDMKGLARLLKRSRKYFVPSKGWGDGGAILITTSGMMDAAASAELLPDLAPRADVHVFLVGYQSPGTSGHALANGAKELVLHDEKGDRKVEVRCVTDRFGCFSGHGDACENDRWLVNNLASDIYLVHGDKAALTARKADLEKRCKRPVTIVRKGETYRIVHGTDR